MSVSVSTPVIKRLAGLASRSQAGTAKSSLSVALYLHDLAGGGVERQTLIIADAFRRYGADVTLVLHRLRGQLLDQIPPGLRVVDLNSSRTIMDVPRLVHFLRRAKPDILMSNVDLNNVAALLAKSISLSKTRIVICQHNTISGSFALTESLGYRLTPVLYRLLSPFITRAVAVSDGVAAELIHRAGVPAERVLTINNPVVGPDFQTRSEIVIDHPWFHQPNRPIFVTAGRLVPQKDHETMLRALALHRKHMDSRLLILGIGPLKASLADLAGKLGLTAYVDFLGFQSNALPYIRQADAFLLSSRCEGFGNVIVESLGCGTPVIATRCEYGPAEILDDGRFGMLVDTANPSAMAKAMDQVGTLRAKFPSAMLQDRASAFSYAACASRYMTMFKAIVPHCAWAVQS